MTMAYIPVLPWAVPFVGWICDRVPRIDSPTAGEYWVTFKLFNKYLVAAKTASGVALYWDKSDNIS